VPHVDVRVAVTTLGLLRLNVMIMKKRLFIGLLVVALLLLAGLGAIIGAGGD